MERKPSNLQVTEVEEMVQTFKSNGILEFGELTHASEE